MTIDVQFSTKRWEECITLETMLELQGDNNLKAATKALAIFLTKDGEYFDDLAEAQSTMSQLSLIRVITFAKKIDVAMLAHRAMLEDYDE